MAQDVRDAVPCQLFQIPARSPNLNPIENVSKETVSKETSLRKLWNSFMFCWDIKKGSLNFSPAINQQQ